MVRLANLFGKLVELIVARDFSERFNEPLRLFLAQRCSNKCGRYVALAEFGKKRRRGAVMISKGRSREGWKAFS